MDSNMDVDEVARPYQEQLEQVAINKNTIINLPTGSGKTFIAIQLINKFKHSLKLPWGEGGKRTFFLVNTVPLVNQQKQVIKVRGKVDRVCGYSGEDGVDYWNKAKWDAELSKYEVIVMTSQILADMLTHSYIKVEDINLLIFDECHHAVEDHPMRLIMKHFEYCPPSKQPRVLGLTATLLNCNVSVGKVKDTLRLLETTFHATIATADTLREVARYSTNPYEMCLYYKTGLESQASVTAINILKKTQAMIASVQLPLRKSTDVKLGPGQKDISVDPKKMIKEVTNMMTSAITFIEELGAYGGALGTLVYIILLERLKRKAANTEEENLYSLAITYFKKARMVLLISMENEKGYNKIVRHSSQKVLQLLEILKEYNPARLESRGVLFKVNKFNMPLSGIIFTKQRFTAKVLFNLLKGVKEENPTEFGFLNHDFIVGANINPTKSTREQYFLKKYMEQTFLKFKNKHLNCLIATNVIEEGVDIPQCTLVVRFDEPTEYRSYIQSKGRARSRESTYVLMVDEERRSKFVKRFQEFQEIESYLQDILTGKTDARKAPSSSAIQKALYEDDVIPPYITPNGTKLSAVSAISLLGRYCSILPHDQFTTITPLWVKEDVHHKNEEMVQVHIYLPIECPVKDIIKSEPMRELKNAKRSAAMNACIRLHQEGELDPVTLLPVRHELVDFDLPEVKSCFPNWPKEGEEETESEDTPRPGTKKRIMKHKKVFPSYLNGPKDKGNTHAYYLHIIKMKTNFPEPSDPREKALYKLLKTNRGFGLLTPNALPKICDFPMFLTVGEVITSLEMNSASITLDKDLFGLVKRFHFFVFKQVLDIAKSFVVFDGTVNNLYVVPIIDNDEYDIDWDVMKTHTEVPHVMPPSIEERRALKVSKEDYQYHVVSPWYRGTIMPDRYIVSNVIEYMTPYSVFDSSTDSNGTYADYYSTRYNLNIYGKKDQPLLEVRNISTRMNCLMPRVASIKSEFTEKQRKQIALAEGDDKYKGFPENFIAEFCIKYDFPGVLWYKAMILPCIIHRVTMLLVAHELREEIAENTKIGKPKLDHREQWEPIIVEKSAAVAALLAQIDSPTPINSVDRINQSGGRDDRDRRPINIMSMKESLYQVQRKKNSTEYPWDEKQEPVDIERNVASVTLMDIECYDEFVSVLMPDAPAAVKVMSPPRPTGSNAILPPPLRYHEKIGILSKKPTSRGPELRDVLAAITTINSHDTFDLERVETLGDSFLKFAASLYLFHKFPKSNEGQLTNIKCRLIGNRNLSYAGHRVRLGGRMKVEQFSPRKDFLVPGFFAPKQLRDFIEEKQIRPTFLIGMIFSNEEALSGNLTEDSQVVITQRCLDVEDNTEHEPVGNAINAMQSYVMAQAVSDKSVADCVEALIGTYLLNDGILAAVKVLEWLKVLPPQDNFTTYLHKMVPTVLSTQKVVMAEIDRLLDHSREDVEKILDYKFKDPSLMLEALSHSSYIRNRLTRSYERLEFLGDAILDFLITSHIFENYPKLKPGELTDLRSALVNNVTFASYVVKIGLHKYLCSELNPLFEKAILEFAIHQDARDHSITEEVLYLIDEKECHLAEYVDVPKVLSDIFESLIGAIYLDCGGDLDTVWRVIYKIMYREIESFSQNIPLQPVRLLYERIHACPSFGTPEVIDQVTQKIMVPVTYTKNGSRVTVYGVGGNKFQAKRAGAKMALRNLNLV